MTLDCFVLGENHYNAKTLLAVLAKTEIPWIVVLRPAVVAQDDLKYCLASPGSSFRFEVFSPASRSTLSDLSGTSFLRGQPIAFLFQTLLAAGRSNLLPFPIRRLRQIAVLMKKPSGKGGLSPRFIYLQSSSDIVLVSITCVTPVFYLPVHRRWSPVLHTFPGASLAAGLNQWYWCPWSV